MSQTLAFAVSLLAWVLILAAPVRAAGPAIAVPGGAVAALVGSDLRQELVEVTDARCPSDVTCVWEGTIRLVIRVNPGGPADQTLVLCNACDDGASRATAAGFQFDFMGLEPEVSVIEGLGRAARVQDYTGFIQITPLSSRAG
jgi:hypothetical protein